MFARRKTAKRLLIAAPLMPAVAFLAPHVFGPYTGYGRARLLWPLGVVWFCACVAGAVMTWRND